MWGTIIGIGASLLGANQQSNAATSAANTQAASTDRAVAENARQYDTTRADYAPYRAVGLNALGQLQSELNTQPTAAEVMNDPGYQFGLNQGQMALDRKFSAAGGRVSGAAMKAAARYGTDYATTGYGATYQRKQDRLNRLAALANVGQTATGSSAAAGAATAGANASLYSAQGNASGAAQMAQGNIWGGAINQIGAAGQKWATTKSGGVTNGALAAANMSSDPLGALISSQEW